MEFQKAIKTLKRMRDYYDDEPKLCPLAAREYADSPYWDDWADFLVNEPGVAETLLEGWNKDYPEPIYPTFGEYLRVMASYDRNLDKIPLPELLDKHIPEAVAERYEVVPLNPYNVNKYVSDWL